VATFYVSTFMVMTMTMTIVMIHVIVTDVVLV